MWIVRKSADEQTMCFRMFPYLCICICLSIGNAEKVKRGGGLWRFAVVMFFCWNVFILCLIIISVSPSSVPAWNHHVKPLQCLLKTPPPITSLSAARKGWHSVDKDDNDGCFERLKPECLSVLSVKVTELLLFNINILNNCGFRKQESILSRLWRGTKSAATSNKGEFENIANITTTKNLFIWTTMMHDIWKLDSQILLWCAPVMNCHLYCLMVSLCVFVPYMHARY